MKLWKGLPDLADSAVAFLSFLLWESVLDTGSQPLWQRAVVYLGEVMFGLTAVLLIGMVRERLAGDRSAGWRAALFGVGLASWPIAVGVSAMSGFNRDDCVAVASAVLLLIFLLTPIRPAPEQESE